jgi:hypothetical protein
MPDNLAARIDLAIRSQARQRVAAMPATETSRRDLPARRPRRWAGGGWHLPGLSVVATRLAAAAGAVVIAGAGSYLVAANVGTSVTPSLSAPPQQMSPGPVVTYGQPGSLHTIRAVHSRTNFRAAHLRAEAITAVHAAQARGVSAAQPPGRRAALLNRSAAPAESPAGGGGTATRLAGCIDLIAPRQTVLLIDIARYQGKPATLIVTAPTAVSEAQALVAGPSCSATTKDVVTRAALGHL